MFGASYTSEMVELLEQQLTGFKNTLGNLYDRKNIEIAKRETARFRYLSIWRLRFETALMDISTDIYNLNQPVTSLVWNAFQTSLKRSIMMESISGKMILGSDGKNAWQTEPAREDGGKLGFLSPLQSWLGVDGKIQSNLRFTGAMEYINPFNYSQRFGEIQLTTGFKKFPWIMEDIAETILAATAGIKNNEQYEAAVKILPYLTKFYPSGWTLMLVLEDGQRYLDDLVTDTMKLIDTQQEINALEYEIQAFMDEYRAYGAISSQASETYQEISKLAQESNEKAVKNAIANPTAAMIQTGEGFPEGAPLMESPESLYPSTQTTPAPAKKTNMLLLVGGAIVGAVVFLG